MTAETSNARGEWVLVPRVPTPEMLAATSWPGCAASDYAHMLAAAPQPPSAPVGAEGLASLLERIRDLLASLPVDCLGSGADASGRPYPIRDEVIHGITNALAQQPAAKPDAVAGLVEKAYAGCTIWRGSLRVSVTETEAIEHRIDADEAFCNLVQRALDSLAAAWDDAALAQQPAEQQAEPDVSALVEAPVNVIYTDGCGAGRRSPADCRYGVSYVTVADTVYWPLSADDAQRLRSAECGRGDFTGPGSTSPNAAHLAEALSILGDIKDWDCDVSGGFLSIPVGLRRRIQEVLAAAPEAAGEPVPVETTAEESLTTEQPAAAGEEIMVNAAHDVYTLPLQPSGLSSGPRFVVHVPGPEQPAAVDEAMVERACKAALAEVWPDTYEEADDLRAMIRRILSAALATQHQEPTT